MEEDSFSYGTNKQQGAVNIERTVATVRAQDASLNMLSGDVQTVRNLATQINVEVDEQNALLDGDAGEAGSLAARMAALQSAIVQSNRESPYNLRTFCCLLWPLVILIVLVVNIVLNWLF